MCMSFLRKTLRAGTAGRHPSLFLMKVIKAQSKRNGRKRAAVPSGEGGSRSGEVSAEHLHGGRGGGQYVSLGVDSGDRRTVLRDRKSVV